MKPNVIFILADQHNAKVLGCKNHPDVKTPNLDRMAEEGVRFENAITQNPMCTPSRVSWLSGQYCHNHGYYGLSGPNPNGLPTVFGHFKKNGYRTAAIGKIHCPEYWVEDDCDLYLETCPGCSIGRNPEYQKYLEDKDLWELEDHGKLQEFGRKGKQSCEGRVSNLSFEDSMEGWSVENAKSFMEQCIEDEVPFFAHISLPKPHQCYTPSEEFWSMYSEDEITLPPSADGDLKGKAPHLKEMNKKWKQGDWLLFEPKNYEAGRLRKLHGYLGSISHVDFTVGEILKWVSDKKLDENTIIIYSSDHGDYACEHGQIEKAPGICSDAITRIPLIWRWKGAFEQKHVAEEIVETVDFVPTLCKLVGIDSLETADGKDISHMLHGKDGEVHEFGVTEFAWSKSVRKGSYRFVYYPKEMFEEEYPQGFYELYDLEKDPWEMENLFFDEKYKDKIQEMKNDLLDWIITTTRPVTVHSKHIEINDQRVYRYKHTVNKDGKKSPDMIRKYANKNYL